MELHVERVQRLAGVVPRNAPLQPIADREDGDEEGTPKLEDERQELHGRVGRRVHEAHFAFVK